MSHQFNFTDAHGNIIIDRQRYLGLHYVDGQRRLSYPTLGHLLAEQNIKRHVLAEEMRLLYVALTRAREHLILLGSGSAKTLEPFSPGLTPEHFSRREPPESFELAEGRSWLDWLVPTLASLGPDDLQFLGPTAHPELTACQATFLVSAYEPDTFAEDIFAEDFGKHRRRGGLKLEQIASLAPPDEPFGSAPFGSSAQGREHGEPVEPLAPDEELARSLSLMEQPYRYEELADMPAVLPLTERKRLFEPASDEDLEELAQVFGQAKTLTELSDLLSAKTGRLSATQIGSLNHLFLQNIDLTRPCDLQDLQQQAKGFTELGLFDKDTLAVLDLEGAAGFFASRIGRTMLANPSAVYREIPFVLAIAPDELVKGVPAAGPADSPLLRGIIDALIVEDSRATIVDFKTDRVTGPELLQRTESYRWQMQMYSRAVQDILGWPVARKILYFLSPRELVTLD